MHFCYILRRPQQKYTYSSSTFLHVWGTGYEVVGCLLRLADCYQEINMNLRKKKNLHTVFQV